MQYVAYFSRASSVRSGDLSRCGSSKSSQSSQHAVGCVWLGDFESLLALSTRHNLCGLVFIVLVIQKYSEVINTRESEEMVGRSSYLSVLLVS